MIVAFWPNSDLQLAKLNVRNMLAEQTFAGAVGKDRLRPVAAAGLVTDPSVAVSRIRIASEKTL